MDNKNSLLGYEANKPQDDLNVSAPKLKLQNIESSKPKKPEVIKYGDVSVSLKNLTKIQELQQRASSSKPPEILSSLKENKSKMLPTIQASQKMTASSMPSIQASQKITASSMPSIQQSNAIPSQVDVIKNTENKIKDLKQKMEEKLKKKEGTNTLKALTPVFQNIESVLKFQGQMNRKDKDYDSEHYTTPLTQSLFNLTANQIGGMPSWL